jgi:hypothetical protein
VTWGAQILGAEHTFINLSSKILLRRSYIFSQNIDYDRQYFFPGIYKAIQIRYNVYMETTYENKTFILSDLWMNYRGDAEFEDFTEYNDLGLPLAYAISNNIVKDTPMSNQFINETFDLLLAGLGISEDEGYDTLDDILGTVI